MNALMSELAALIAQRGSISVADYMGLALRHYYATRDPLGASGDFTTAPEIHQMFGEMIGLWLVQAWRDGGAPAPVSLAELGPGRGTLMKDLLRVIARVAPELRAALAVHLVETSPALRARQAACLPDGMIWHDAFDTVPQGPLLLVANEFFDALPIRQFVRTPRGFSERKVAIAGDALVFATNGASHSAADVIAPALFSVPEGSIIETRPAGELVATEIGRRIQRHGGAALIIDYGHAAAAPGDTLQAVCAHAYADPLANPGEADITAHVDFSALAAAARLAGARVCGPQTQGRFFLNLGIDTRAATLARNATHEDAKAIEIALARLTAPDQMGTLFKVMAILPAAAAPPAGFDGTQ